MAIIKNEIPILEFDDELTSVVMPNHENLNMKLPSKAVFAFLYDAVDDYAKRCNAKVVGEFVSATKTYPIYVVTYKNESVCLVQAPVGASAAVQILDWLYGYGVDTVISAGSCGTLVNIPENHFLIPVKALRDEGTSYHYASPSRFMDVSKQAVEAIEQTLNKYNIEYKKVITWSTDGFFRETPEKVKYRINEGCSVVEMECAALAACASFRQKVWGELLYTADSLADTLNYDSRDFGQQARRIALELCLDILTNIKS